MKIKGFADSAGEVFDWGWFLKKELYQWK